MEKYYITTPIYYVNDKPHIGHAYTSLACDVLARFMRLAGKEVFFLTGTDEHGQKVQKSAEKRGISPKGFCDEVSEHFRNLADEMNYSADDFIRTTEERHKQAAQQLWQKLADNCHIYLDKYSGWYAVRDEAYYTEAELVDGKAPTGADVEWVEEESYFFDLSKWQQKLLDLYEQNPDFISPASRRNEVISFVKSGLKDLSISRTSFDWGVPVPGNEQHVMYVWLDALTNYLTAAGWSSNNDALYRKFWADSPSAIHIVGKDILRFHAIYWPAFLMAADLPLPRKIVAHGWWTNEGEKISKSLGNVIDPIEIKQQYGLDSIRYFMLREVPFGNDGNFSADNIVTRINSELANKVGNLAQRVLSFIAKNCDGKIAKIEPDILNKQDLQLIGNSRIQLLYDNILSAIDDCKFHDALEQIIRYADDANIYIDEQAPWQLRKSDLERMVVVLAVLLEAIRVIALLLQPFIPDSAEKILQQLNIAKEHRAFSNLHDTIFNDNIELDKPEPVFPRFETS